MGLGVMSKIEGHITFLNIAWRSGGSDCTIWKDKA